MNTPKSTGKSWDQLEEKVDNLVEALREEKSLPGMTVAVTKAGRLCARRRHKKTSDEGLFSQQNRQHDKSAVNRSIGSSS